MNRLYEGDCLKTMDNLISEGVSVDALVTDLPYGLTANKQDVRLDLKKLWPRFLKLVKPNGVMAFFSQGLFYIDLVNSNRNMFRYDLIWDKVLVSGFLNAKRMPMRNHEQIAIFYQRAPVYNPQMTVGKPLHSKGKNFKNKEIVNRNYGKFEHTDDIRVGCTEKYPVSIITFPKPHPSVSCHPTEKSISCNEWLIRTYTNEGDTVLDCCMGVGTSGIAAHNCGRDFIGIEKDKTYFDIAVERLINCGIEEDTCK